MPVPLGLPPQHSTSTLPNNIDFGQVIKEALTYSDMAQALYPPLSEPLAENLASTAKATSEELHYAPSLLAFIDLRQRGTLRMLLEAFLHPKTSLLQT